MKKMNENIAKVLLSEEEIQKRVKELGRQIHDDYKDKDKIVMIGLLKGAIYFFTDLSLAIDGYGLDYAGDYRNLPFIGVLKPEAYAK